MFLLICTIGAGAVAISDFFNSTLKIRKLVFCCMAKVGFRKNVPHSKVLVYYQKSKILIHFLRMLIDAVEM